MSDEYSAGPSAVKVQNLTMTYRVPDRPEGVRGALRSLVKREFRAIEALHGISFELGTGTSTGLIGPNGAGKTTTLKLLSGVLHPTAGTARVLGSTPWKRDPSYLRDIALVRGSRPISAPIELTLADALRFQAIVYGVGRQEYKQALDELTEILHIQHLLRRQIRALSLGERMRAGLASSLIYRPKLLFFDEPTLGLDIDGVDALRTSVREYRESTNATVILTSHNMNDVEHMCEDLIVIDHGRIRYSGTVKGLSERFSQEKVIQITLREPLTSNQDASRFGQLLVARERELSILVHRSEVPKRTAEILATLPVADLVIADPALEETIRSIYHAEESFPC